LAFARLGSGSFFVMLALFLREGGAAQWLV
jgi:hypothetical protein